MHEIQNTGDTFAVSTSVHNSAADAGSEGAIESVSNLTMDGSDESGAVVTRSGGQRNIITDIMFYSSSLLSRLSAACLAAAIVLVPTLVCGAQIQTPPSGQQNGPVDVWEEQQRKAMAKKANEERQQEIKKDAEKLLELATELKHAVDKSSENTLSLDVIKKAERIEKLAKQVKDKMKGP